MKSALAAPPLASADFPEFAALLKSWQVRMEEALGRRLPDPQAVPARLHEAMRYSVLGGGKRIRPALVFATARTLGLQETAVEAIACAIEFVHVYSLVHDDLPAMDDDDLRRGRPTCHKVFGDAMAILAGDGLLTLAFEVLAKLDVDAERRVGLAYELATASGTIGGMIGGQVNDLEGEGKFPTAHLLGSIHRAKTGALLRASVRMGAIYAGADSGQLDALTRFGEHVGLAFQIVDDVLDVEQPSEALGKTAGKDVKQKKITFPAVYGIERSREMAEHERLEAHLALRIFDDRAERLRQLADYIVRRRA